MRTQRQQQGGRTSQRGQQWYLEGEIPDDLQDVLSPGYYWAWENDNGTYDFCTNTEGLPVHLPASEIPEQLTRLHQERVERKTEDSDIFLMPPTPSRPSSAVSPPSRATCDWISGSQVKSIRLLKQLKPELRVSSHWVSPLTARQRVTKEITIPSTTTGRPTISPKKYKPPIAPVPPEWDYTSRPPGVGIPPYDSLYDFDCHHLYPGILKSLRKQRDLPQEYQFVLRERMEQFMERINFPLPPRSSGGANSGIEWYNSPLYHTAVLRRDSGNDGDDGSPPTFHEEHYSEVITAIKQAGVRTDRLLSVEEGGILAKEALVEIMSELRMPPPPGMAHEESEYGREYSECSNELWRLLNEPAVASTYYSLLATIKELLMYRRKTLEIIEHMLHFDDAFHELSECSYALLLSDPRVASTAKKMTQWAERANTIRALLHRWTHRYARFASVGESPYGTFIWKHKEVLRYIEDALHLVQRSDEARGDEGVGCGAILAHVFRSTYFKVDDPLTMGPTPTWFAPGVSDVVRRKMQNTGNIRGRFRRKSRTSEGKAKLPWAGRR
eukprot:GEMP01021251.1.p1 GENE.GEMP01021251.1~~GEMP01021251.1.p1  ORF type:complete len:555 (+),score=115.69 GEMP01021251.1:400-2064(+)